MFSTELDQLPRGDAWPELVEAFHYRDERSRFHRQSTLHTPHLEALNPLQRVSNRFVPICISALILD
jgi:hypothetical protein